MHTHRGTSKGAIAIVGGDSLLGKEVRDLLESTDLRAGVTVIAADESEDSSVISIRREEPEVMTSLQASDLSAAKVAVLAASKEASRKLYGDIHRMAPTAVIVDLTGALEDRPEARLRAPIVEAPSSNPPSAIQVIAHPAAIALALLLTQLRKAVKISQSVVSVFEPVSERGQAGIDELQKQTVGLLSFKPLPKDLYDAQISFNMLSEYGSEAPQSLGAIEQKIDRHLASLLSRGDSIPMPSLRLIQAPVFHGYSMSLWVEFESNPEVETIQRDLASSHIDVRTSEHEPPTNVGVAGQNGITVGSIAIDRNHPRACWFWLVADNLRIAAQNAVEVIREVVQ
jgi:aspartate-semialdehyde dehydrogenase